MANPPKHLKYGVCYDNWERAKATKIYALTKYCDCPSCKGRSLKKEPVNWLSVTTKEISKVDDVAEFLKTWICNKGGKYVGLTCMKFQY